MSEDEQRYFICVDPKTHWFYTINANTNEMRIEEDAEQDPTMKARAEEAIRDLHKIINLQESNWIFKSDQTKQLQRRKIPSYLLNKDCTKYPKHLCQSSLSLAFSKVNTINLNVHLDEYVNILRDKRPQDCAWDCKMIKIEAGLVTGADEVIKNILRRIYKDYRIALKPKDPNKQIILQVKGYREYLTGDHPMLNYDRVRASLRGLDHLDVKLTEMPIVNANAVMFPPICHRKQSDIDQQNYTPIDWKNYYDVPILLWYPWVELPPKGTTNPNTLLKYLMRSTKSSQQNSREKQYQNLSEILESNTSDSRKSRTIQQNGLFSGECDSLFKVRVCGLQNIFKLLEAVDPKLNATKATYNGFSQPAYVTLAKQTAEESEEGKGQNHKEDNKPHKDEKASKQNPSKPKVTKSDITPLINTMKTSAGGAGIEFMEQLYNYYGLNFVPNTLSVEVMLLNGSTCIAKVETVRVPFSQICKYNEWISFKNIKVSQLPLESRLCFNLKMYAASVQLEPQIIGSSVLQIFNIEGLFEQGLKPINVWPVHGRLSCMNEYWGYYEHIKQGEIDDDKKLKEFASKHFCQLFIQMERYTMPMYYSLRDEKTMESLGLINPYKNNSASERHKNFNQTPKTEDLARLQFLLNADPLKRPDFTAEDKHILMISRNHYKTLTQALQVFLLAVDWLDPEQVKEALLMLKLWTPLQPEDALPLLDAHISNEDVRLYAVERISTFSDDDLALYMLELTQLLLYERNHFSPLAEMLLERSLQNPFVVGHEFFWQLKSQLNVKAFHERFSLLIEQYIMICGSYRKEITNQVSVNESLKSVAKIIQFEAKQQKDLDVLKIRTREELKKIRQHLPKPNFSLALDSRIQVSEFSIKDCKCMDSKKKPLWLDAYSEVELDEYEEGQFDENGNPKKKRDKDLVVKILFKRGDDIRQDQLTLQLMKIMDKIWLDAGQDFRMKLYKVITTGDQVGMIEVVTNADTTANIHKIQGGGAYGALRDNTLLKYLQEKNPKEQLDTATDNFIRSCAGYCVATYILGIGDRHPDNIMLSYTGHLFHIDFGHFLGNFKKKYGIDRERAPFVFTEEMAYVMKGIKSAEFKNFTDLCTQAYNLVRKQGNFIINIFLLMLDAGIPELQSSKHIEYLKTKLALQLSEQEATNKFKKEIYISLNSKFRRFDNFIHNLVRK